MMCPRVEHASHTEFTRNILIARCLRRPRVNTCRRKPRKVDCTRRSRIHADIVRVLATPQVCILARHIRFVIPESDTGECARRTRVVEVSDHA